ncbi:DUF742 domain-containing protein [Actinomadura rayongensis]|uniref:DUF742 domain-containing protein n=1 Tax=Actinomadura rayongensis TaxID=1429076 RepID=A0A6I4WAZ0_9ACTN|nr:DUF742 domain-containing protein [Actinomadura rayongensis]
MTWLAGLDPTRWGRPYTRVGGRIRTPRPLLVHTLVHVPHYDASVAATLPPWARTLYQRAAASSPVSLAELSADCAIALGVARVVLSDLSAAGHVHLGSGAQDPRDTVVLGRVLDGLRKLA